MSGSGRRESHQPRARGPCPPFWSSGAGVQPEPPGPARAEQSCWVVVSAGLIDVTINVASMTALADRPGRLVAFHARFNVGAAGRCRHLRWSVGAAHLVAVDLVADTLRGGPSFSLSSVAALPYRVPSEANRGPLAQSLSPCCATSGCSCLLESSPCPRWSRAASTCGECSSFGRTSMPACCSGQVGVVLGYSVAAVARTTLGPAIGRRGPPRGVAMGAGVASVGTGGAPGHRSRCLPWGLPDSCWRQAGISMCWPLLVAAAGKGPPPSMVPPLSVRSPLAGMWGWWQDRHSSGVWPALSDFRCSRPPGRCSRHRRHRSRRSPPASRRRRTGLVVSRRRGHLGWSVLGACPRSPH